MTLTSFPQWVFLQISETFYSFLLQMWQLITPKITKKWILQHLRHTKKKHFKDLVFRRGSKADRKWLLVQSFKLTCILRRTLLNCTLTNMNNKFRWYFSKMSALRVKIMEVKGQQSGKVTLKYEFSNKVFKVVKEWVFKVRQKK